jgi:molybdate transport system substrate-binding protein
VKRTLKMLLVLLAASSLFVAGCSDSKKDDKPKSTGRYGKTALKGVVTVSGAASLKDSFTTIGDAFAKANPQVKVTFNFDASSTLASQITEGAPADVFASADEANMTKLTDAKLVTGKPAIFARNQLVIVTKPGNPKGIKTLADLAAAGVVSLCGVDVPCGKYAKQALDTAGVAIPEASVTRGQNAGATLTAVSTGDAVAGIVYVTDAISAGDTVEAVDIPSAQNVIATYPIGVLKASGNAKAAQAFVDYVQSDDGQAVLKDKGFLPPT